VVALIAVTFALDAPGYVSRQYDRFVHVSGSGGTAGDVRTRLIDPANNGRIAEWHVGLEGFSDAPIKGNGAGTYQLLWEGKRSASAAQLNVIDGHSLYVEVLGELGIVGLGLLAIVIATILTGLALRLRGRHRALYGAFFAAAIAWALHAGVDWDWEMPVITLWFFAVGGVVLARSGRQRQLLRSPSLAARAAISVGLMGVAVTPALVLASQTQLNDAVTAFKRGDCAKAVSDARSSSSTLGMRPEPYQIRGFCYARRGSERQALQAMNKAIKRDPDNWEFRYGLALVRAAGGLDPRPAARAALRLNPLDELTTDAVKRFRTNDPRAWKRQVRTAGLPHEPPFRFADIGRQAESIGTKSASR
jgi:hypothetical protein